MKIAKRTLDRLNDLWFVANLTSIDFSEPEIEIIKLGLKLRKQPNFPPELSKKINKMYNEKLNKQI
jgi:hypothetical protein